MKKPLILVVFLGVLLGGFAGAAADPASLGEALRANLASARVAATYDPKQARVLLQSAQQDAASIVAQLKNPGLQNNIRQAFAKANSALNQNNPSAFARQTVRVWTTLLLASKTQLEQSLQDNDAVAARRWLGLREFRQAMRFTPPNADATLALELFAKEKISRQEALNNVRADLLDAYQARLNTALQEAKRNLERRYNILAAENMAFAVGYFEILAGAAVPPNTAKQAFATLEAAPNLANLEQAQAAIQAWRAAPLSDKERNKRAVQTLRFLALVPVEYARGVKTQNGRWSVVKDLEITEASVFLQGANAAFADIAPLLGKANNSDRRAIEAAFQALQTQLANAANKTKIVPSQDLQTTVDGLLQTLRRAIPESWQRQDAAADLDVIRNQLQQLELAAASGDYALVEGARINAYAILESGTEARIKFFQPQLAQDIEALFWNGLEPKGLARLIAERAPQAAFRTTRETLEAKLQEAARFVGSDASPVAMFLNALVIVFREGLEAVLILAALLGSLKAPAVRHLRRPLWLGALASFAATVVTFLVLRGIVNAFASFGERLEAVISVIAVLVLLVIMNWFFHNVYWNDHLASFHKQKHSLLGNKVGQNLGLGLLGFTAMYREGFETVLFLQSLVLQGGLLHVLLGTALALVLVVLVGVAVFVMQTKLPHKKMLIATGVMICAVLWVMVGNTVHMLQIVGWFPIHPVALALPHWSGLWAGTYATLEGLLLQTVAVVAVFGSYFLAEGLKQRDIKRKQEVSGVGNSQTLSGAALDPSASDGPSEQARRQNHAV